jgi:hypothetical protein
MDDIIRGVIHPGEKVLWSGMPEKSRIFSTEDLFYIPFSLIWLALALTWEAGVFKIFYSSHDSVRLLMLAFGAVFIIIGIYLLAGRIIYRFYLNRNTYYAVLDKRVVIVKDVIFKNVFSIEIQNIGGLKKRLYPSGTGDVVFGNDRHIVNSYQNYIYNPATGVNQPYFTNSIRTIKAPGFYGIRDAEKVYEIIKERK